MNYELITSAIIIINHYKSFKYVKFNFLSIGFQ